MFSCASMVKIVLAGLGYIAIFEASNVELVKTVFL